MEIHFTRDITRRDQDGLGLIYSVDGQDLKVQVSRTFLGMFGIQAENAEELFEQCRLELMIQSIHDQYQGNKGPIEKIDLDSYGAKIKGKVYFSPDDLRKFIAKRK